MLFIILIKLISKYNEAIYVTLGMYVVSPPKQEHIVNSKILLFLVSYYNLNIKGLKDV